jgi:hypothetical protein
MSRTNQLERKNNQNCMDYLAFIFNSVKQITDVEQQLKGWDFSGIKGKTKYTIDAKVIDLKPKTVEIFKRKGIQFSYEVIQRTKANPEGPGWGVDPNHCPDFLLWILDGNSFEDAHKKKTKDYHAVLMVADTFKEMAAATKNPHLIIKNPQGEYMGECKYITLLEIERWEKDYNKTIIVDHASPKQIQKRLKGFSK